jgi:hypothetical protein
VLALQRRVGNRAVQRAIGFELEIPLLATKRPVRRGIRARHAVDAAADFGELDAGWALSERLPKKHRLVTGEHFGLEADDAGPRSSDAEFVTDPFPENGAGRGALLRALTGIEDMAETINQLSETSRARGRFPLATELNATRVDDPETFLFGVAKLGKPQATFGLRLAQVGAFLKDIYPAPNESPAEGARRDAGREAVTKVSTARGRAALAAADPTTLSHGRQVARVMGLAPGLAVQALTAYRAANPAAPPPTREILSLLALVYSYLEMGRRGLVRSYAKTIGPLMARTDFRTLFTLLSEPERAYYSGRYGGRWSELVWSAPGYAALDIDHPVFEPIRESRERTQWYRVVSRRAWLTEMAADYGWFSLLGYKARDLLSTGGFPTRAGRREIEGLGGYGARTDVVQAPAGPVEAPILEQRMTPENMRLPDFSRWALRMFDYVVALNRGDDRKFGE